MARLQAESNGLYTTPVDGHTRDEVLSFLLAHLSKMAPFFVTSALIGPNPSNSIPVCSDPSVVPPDGASRTNKDLWWLHGHPHSKRYSNLSLTSLVTLVRYESLTYQDQPGFLYLVGPEISYEAIHGMILTG